MTEVTKLLTVEHLIDLYSNRFNLFAVLIVAAIIVLIVPIVRADNTSVL
jgi:hypothetical protein